MKVAWWVIVLSVVFQSALGLVFTVWIVEKTAHDTVQKMYETQEVFCKECCWQTEYFYTCTKDKKDLFKRIP